MGEPASSAKTVTFEINVPEWEQRRQKARKMIKRLLL